MRHRVPRLVVFGSHPVPYRSPLYRLLAKRDDVEILVLYGDDYGARPRRSGWGVEDFVWEGGVVEGHPHVFLKNVARRPDPSTFWGKVDPDLVSRLRAFAPDAALVMGYRGAYALQALAACKVLGIRLLYLTDDGERAPIAGMRGFGKERWLRALYPHIDGFLAIGDRNRAHYRSLGVPERRLFPFPYAVDNEAFRRDHARLSPSRDALRARWQIPPLRTCVVFCGRLIALKNVAELIRAAAALPDVHLLIVGSGPEGPALESLAASLLPGRATFTGFLNQDQLAEAYVAADVFALPSNFEAWGLVCNEALNFGLPIVVSDRVGAGPELAVQGSTGWVYPLGDVPTFARCLREAAEAVASNRAGIAAAAMRQVDRWSMDRQVAGVLEALAAVVARD